MNEQVELIFLDHESKMEKTIQNTLHEFNQVRTGRANPALLDKVVVSYYGVDTPVRQISSIQVVEGTQLYIKPFDKSILKDVETAIQMAKLDLPTSNDGIGIRLILPKLTEESRKVLVKDVEKLQENGKVAIRNIRRDLIDDIKAIKLPEDEEKDQLEEVQKLTDKYIKILEEETKKKIEDVRHI